MIVQQVSFNIVDLLVHDAKIKNISPAFRQLQALLQPLTQLQDINCDWLRGCSLHNIEGGAVDSISIMRDFRPDFFQLVHAFTVHISMFVQK